MYVNMHEGASVYAWWNVTVLDGKIGTCFVNNVTQNLIVTSNPLGLLPERKQ